MPTPATARAREETTRLEAVRFQGVQSLPVQELQAVVKPWLGRDLTFADLDAMTAAVTNLYRERGYLVASAYLGAQTMTGGTLTVTVVEGKFSRIVVRSNKTEVSDAQILRTLAENLCRKHGDCKGVGPVRTRDVERAGLIVSEIPGVEATYEMKAGDEPGSTSLFLDAARAPRFSVTVAGDNTGFEYTGANRGTLGFSVNNLLNRGDQTTLSTTYSGKGLFSFALDSSLPVGYRGARAGVSAALLRYALGGSFAVLDATGESYTAGAYVTYPAIRSLQSSMDVRLDLVGRDIRNEIATINFQGKARSGEAMISVAGNQLDHLFRSAATQYRFAYTQGQLDIRDAGSRVFDGLTAKTNGPFGKFSYTLRREEVLVPGWTLFGQISGQYALANLDSSQKFTLGGSAAVRAYDAGAGSADTATLATLETRVRIPESLTGRWQIIVAPFADYAWAQFNHRNWAGYNAPKRGELAGAGIYLSIADPGHYTLRATYARRQPTGRDVIASGREQFWLEAAAAF